jgi:hypothetical protein
LQPQGTNRRGFATAPFLQFDSGRPEQSAALERTFSGDFDKSAFGFSKIDASRGAR